MKTKIISAFCGTGKSYLCDILGDNAIELECWKYDKSDLPNNIVTDIKSFVGKAKYIFISTNPIVLDRLISEGIEFNLYYPMVKGKPNIGAI